MWRFRGTDPGAVNAARAARAEPLEPLPPEPFPSRVDAFLTACALHAGQRERDLMNIVEGLGKGIEDAQRQGR